MARDIPDNLQPDQNPCADRAAVERCLNSVESLLGDNEDFRAAITKIEARYPAIAAIKKTIDPFPKDGFGKHEQSQLLADLTRDLNNGTTPQTYTDFVETVRADAQELKDAMAGIDLSLRLFDATYNSVPGRETAAQHAAIKARRERLGTGYDALKRKPLEQIAALSVAEKSQKQFYTKLKLDNASDYLIEIVPTAEAKEAATILNELILTSAVKDTDKRLRYSLALTVDYHYPVFFASVGLVTIFPYTSGFDFMQHRLNQLPVEAPDPDNPGTTIQALRTELDIEKTETYEWLTGAAMSHFGKRMYFTLGTTIDRNIFKNLIVGATYYVPKYRIVLTAGRIGARGAKEEDLLAIQEDYTRPDGSAIPGIQVARIPSGRDWHWQWFFAVSFKPF